MNKDYTLSMQDDTINRQAAIDAFDCSIGGVPVDSVKYVADYAHKMIYRIKNLPSAQLQYEELTPEEAASEIACGSIMSAWHWLDVMMQLKQMGYAICRKR